MRGESGEGFPSVGHACDDVDWDSPWETLIPVDMPIFKPAGVGALDC